MPVKKEREYRTVAAPLSVAAAAKRIDTEYYVEGYATTFDKKVTTELHAQEQF